MEAFLSRDKTNGCVNNGGKCSSYFNFYEFKKTYSRISPASWKNDSCQCNKKNKEGGGGILHHHNVKSIRNEYVM